MVRYFENPKPYSKVLDEKFVHNFIVSILVISGMLGAYWISQKKNIFSALLLLIVFIIFIYVTDKIYKNMSKNDRGVDAEMKIRKELGKLPNDYIIFQNVPIKKNLDIDLVLVGPIGVYAIEVKSHRKFYDNGNGKDFISQTMSEASGLKDYLVRCGVDVFVNPVLVFSRAFVKFGFTPQRGVYVIGKGFLIPLLERGRKINFDQARVQQAIQKLYSLHI